MSKKKYLNYYNYLVENWNEKIAKHIIQHEIIGEKKYGINTSGYDTLIKLEKKGIDISHSTIYMPAPYDMLTFFFEKVDLKKYKHFVDLGCGKGRSLCVAASYGVKKITGIDISSDLIKSASDNIEQIKLAYPKTKFKLYNNDAFYFKIEKDVDCIFLFNPFDDIIMSGILENIETSLEKYPRKITVIYINPLDKKMLLDYGYKEVYHYRKMRYLEGVILEK